MIKEQISQELKKEFAQGNLKPSRIKKSKSLNDLLVEKTKDTRRNSVEPIINENTLKAQLTESQDEISILALKVETQSRELTEFKAENAHLKEQAEIKQKEVEDLRQELDASLAARHQGLKDWNQEHAKVQALNSELNETIEQSAEEINQNDQTITSLKSQLFKTQQQINSLQRDLNLTAKLAEMRKVPYYSDEFSQSLTYFKYFLYSVITVGFMMFLIRKREVNNANLS